MALTDFLTDIANAIRYAEGSVGTINAQQFATRIRALSGGQPIPPTPVRPTIPDGYWQFKTTTPYKYFILGTDDSTSSDPYFYRLLRSYGFPYTCNVIADYMDRRMSNDVIDGFTSEDAPSLFPSAPTTREFLAFCKDRDDIEFALHGTSAEHLLDTRKMTDELWTSYYSYYTSQGGTKTLSEFKDAVMLAVADYDIAQGCPYVERSRNAIEEVIGKYVDTVGCWGGTSSGTVDGIEIPMTELDSKDYDWRGNGWSAMGYFLVGKYMPSYVDRNDYIRKLQRDSGGISDFVEDFNLMQVGDCIELFHHFTDSSDIATHKQQLATIKQYVDEGKAKVVTRKQFADLGEYVDDAHAIQSINLVFNKDKYTSDDVPSKADFTCNVNYRDGSSGICNEDVIVDTSLVDVDVDDVYTVYMYYRGYTSSTSVVVQNSSIVIPSDIPSGYYYEIAKCNDNNYYFLIAQNESFDTGGWTGSNTWMWHSLNARTCYSFISTDMQTWTKIKDASSGIANIKSNDSSWWSDASITSKNFETIVSVTQKPL